MQSQLAGKARWIVSSVTHKRFPLWVRSSSSTSRTADTAIHSEEPEGIDAEQATIAKLAQEAQQKLPNNKGVERNQPSKQIPYASPPKIESSSVHPPLDPINQQRRHYNVENRRVDLKDVSCVGVDGYPNNGSEDRKKQDEEEDCKEYYKDHKPSPISEVEFVDTRKPITKATDGGASAKSHESGEGGIIVWKEEQLESAEETLMRAIRIWKETAIKGNPDFPHSRALRAALRARGEYTV